MALMSVGLIAEVIILKRENSQQVTCEREDDVNDVIAVDGHDQRLSILKNIPNNNSKPICLIDQIFPPVT
ncbi:hypothetical protein KEM48_012448, partial [Puccinia striiformis f. sp. tritici PST-130]